MVTTQFLKPSILGNLCVICKVVDILRHPAIEDLLDNEAHAYAALQNLQGQVIPTFYGVFKVWGILKFLALEPVGDGISEDENINQKHRIKMKAALQCIHNAGYIHGDIARRNFCRMQDGRIFLVDLQTCQPARDQSELHREMNQIDQL